MTSHRDRILDQFSRQAVPFSTAAPIRDAEAIARIVAASGAGCDDEVLDVACGPGLVACGFAPHVRRVVGVDVTPAMLERAREVAAAQGATNVEWRRADVTALPFADASFPVVVTRFALHHMVDPTAVVAEMHRVCRPGGRLVLVDLLASDDPQKAGAFHRMEILRDPSHARALTRAELGALLDRPGVQIVHESADGMDVALEGVLSRSFPRPGDDAVIRAMFETSLADDAMGLRVRRIDGAIWFTYPTAMLVAEVR